MDEVEVAVAGNSATTAGAAFAIDPNSDFGRQ
jgi:hypothetical protein